MSHGVTAGERFRSWSDIQANAARGAGGLSALGVGEDDSVALMLRNDFATFEVNMAAGQISAYAVPINWHFTPEEAGYILGDCAAKVLVAHADLLAQIGPGIPAGVKVLVVPVPAEIGDAYNLPPERRQAPAGVQTWDEFVAASSPNAQAPKLSRGSMIYTSGTTGRPKGVRRRPSTPELQTAGLVEVARYWGITADPSIVVMMNGPMYHSAPAAYAMTSARLGVNIVLQPRFEAEDMLRLIQKHRVSHMHIVPTMLVRLLRLPDKVKRRYDLSSLRWVTHGAAPCAPAVKRQMIEWWGPVINEYYGATETGIVV
jgi:long-chain acyl-CoA synthetase